MANESDRMVKDFNLGDQLLVQAMITAKKIPDLLRLTVDNQDFQYSDKYLRHFTFGEIGTKIWIPLYLTGYKEEIFATLYRLSSEYTSDVFVRGETVAKSPLSNED